MKLYGISGLGADERMFASLDLSCEFIPMAWITPLRNEKMETYARRLAEVIDTSEPFGLLGLSFGGMVATEISKILHPEITFLISSVATKNELPELYKMIGRMGFLDWMPAWLFDPPRASARYFFGTENPLLKQIMDDTDLDFAKWAVNSLTQWQNTTLPNNCIRIAGTADRMLPPVAAPDTYLIEGGTHFMIVDRAPEVSTVINQILEAKQKTLDTSKKEKETP